jgi:glycosyltransferase involved in cell wall biosynthesis
LHVEPVLSTAERRDAEVRILFIGAFPPPEDGIARHNASLVAAFEELGHDVAILASGKGGEQDQGTSRSIQRSIGVLPNRSSIRFIDTAQPDVALVTFAIPTFAMGLASLFVICTHLKRRGIPLIIGFHEPVRDLQALPFVGHMIYAVLRSFASASFAFSPPGAKALREQLRFSDVAVVPLGVPPEAMVVGVRHLPPELGIDANLPSLLMAGFIHPDKGAGAVLEVANDLARDIGGPLEIVISGTPRKRSGLFRFFGRIDQRHYADLRARAGELDHAVRVHFVGFVPMTTLTALISSATIVVLPYQRATQSSMANAALGAAAATVASDLPGLVDDLGDAARYFRTGDTQDLRRALAAVLGSADEQERIREAALRRREERSLHSSAAAIIDIARNVVEGRP